MLMREFAGGKFAWKWGEDGRAHVGPDARKRAIAEGLAAGDIGDEEAGILAKATEEQAEAVSARLAMRKEAEPLGGGRFRECSRIVTGKGIISFAPAVKKPSHSDHAEGEHPEEEHPEGEHPGDGDHPDRAGRSQPEGAFRPECCARCGCCPERDNCPHPECCARCCSACSERGSCPHPECLGRCVSCCAGGEHGASSPYLDSRWRFFSAGYVEDRHLDIPEECLRDAAALWAPKSGPLTVFVDHDLSARSWVGKVLDASFAERKGDVPCGVEGTMRLFQEADPKVFLGVKEGVLRSTSAGIDYEWEKSHPDMDGLMFWLMLGELGPDGKCICRRMTKLNAVWEQSLVWEGAIPSAKRLDASRRRPTPNASAAARVPGVFGAGARDPAGMPPAPEQEEPMELTRIRAALGLSATATEAEIEAKIATVATKTQGLEVQVASLAEAHRSAAAERDGLKARAEAAEGKLSVLEAEAADRKAADLVGRFEATEQVTPATRARFIELAKKDAAFAEALMRDLPKVVAFTSRGVEPAAGEAEPQTFGDVVEKCRLALAAERKVPVAQVPTKDAIAAARKTHAHLEAAMGKAAEDAAA